MENPFNPNKQPQPIPTQPKSLVDSILGPKEKNLSEEELQKARESNYRKVIENPEKREIRETIDIYNTPLIFRSIALQELLDYDRTSKLRPRGKLLLNPQSWRYDQPGIYFEAPVPFAQGGSLESEIAENIIEKYPKLNKQKLQDIVKNATLLAHLMDRDRRSKDYHLLNQNENKARETFIKNTLKDSEGRDIWLALQREVLTGEGIYNYDLGIYSRPRVARRDMDVLVKIDEVDGFSINPDQHHADCMFEILLQKNIDVRKIVGVFLYTNSKEKLSEYLPKISDYLTGHTPGKERKVFNENLETVKALFPFEDFSTIDTTSKEKINEFDKKVLESLAKYILQKYGVDPDNITVGDFYQMVIKNLGIPIYNREGDQIWPEKKTHDEIVKELKEGKE